MNITKDDEEEEEEGFLSDFTPSTDYGESDSCLKGPPFSPKDYMISPSESDEVTAKESSITQMRKLRPEDLKIESNAPDAHKTLRKLLSLLRDKFASKYIKRQINLVQAIVTGMPKGFMVEDLSPLNEVLEYFMFNYTSVPEYVYLIKMILDVAVNPPRITKSSDVLNCKKELSDYFTMLGELLAVFDDETIQFRVFDVLNALLVRPVPHDITCIKLPQCYAAMENSLLPYTIANMLETVSNKLYPIYLNVTLQMIIASKKACITMIQTGAMEFILVRLDPNYDIRDKNVPPPDPPFPSTSDTENKAEYYEVLDTVGHLMWNFLCTLSDYNIVCKSPTQNALWSLRLALHNEAKKGTSKAIASRNNLAALVIKLLTVFGEDLPIVMAGLAVDVAMLSVATEIGTKNTWAENISFGISRPDYMLKKFMLIGCCELAKEEFALGILREQKVLEGILDLINPGLTQTSIPWMPSQFLNLFLLGLPILSEIVPLLPDVYVANKGNTRLLLTLEWFMEEYFDNIPLNETLKTLCALVSCKNSKLIIQDLKEQQGIKTLLNICFYILETQTLKKKDQHKLTRIFIILEKLCKNETRAQSCLGSMYVNVSIKFLSRAVSNCESDSKLDPGLLICFSGFLWEAVAWCPTLLKSFTEQRGIYLLLDLAEMSSYPVQIMILGLLVDMADEGETLTHFLTWRDSEGYGILNTMIKIWKKEEFLNKVPRTATGCIADIERPLMSDEQWYMTNCIKNPHIFSPAIAEMMCNARPKIHSLYQLLKKRYKEMTDIHESLYSVSFSVVQPQHQVYIPLIEHFLLLKLGEVWFEVYNDVIKSGSVPTAAHGEVFATLLEERNNWACAIKKMQDEIMTFQKHNASDNEGKFYQLIRSCCLSSALDALHELDYIARTSYKDVQISTKINQLKEIESSLSPSFVIDDTHVHRTAVRDTNVTYLNGKYVWFKSERDVLPESNLIEPVSPDSSSCNVPDDV